MTGYVLKDAGREELLHALRAVGEGRTALPSDLLRLAVTPTVGPAESDLARLTRREREVLALIRGGLTNKAIARELGISPGTVKAHVEKVIAKLGVSDNRLVGYGLDGLSELWLHPADFEQLATPLQQGN